MPPTDPPARLLTGPMVALLAAVALGWSAESLTQATLPLLILDRGGDAALVGFVGTIYALPSLVMRPLIGRRIDRIGHGFIHQLGGVLICLAPIGFLVPSVIVLQIARFAQGLGWAMYGTANNVVLVRLAPAAKRGQASSYFNVMWAVGLLLGPPLGLALYTDVSREAPFLLAAAFAAGGLVAATVLRRMVPAPQATPQTSVSAHAEPAPISRLRGVANRLVEPSAVPMMLILASFMTGQTLFLAFAPVYARAIGEPDSVLAAYFPMYGVILVVGQLLTGQLSDRFGRRRTIILGSCLGAAGLLIAVVGGSWLSFSIGAGAFACASAIVTSATAAATIDRMPAGRAGVGMATFSMGYAIAYGIGGAILGILITAYGFGIPFVGAAALQVVCVALALRFLHGPPSRPATEAASAV